MTGLTAHVYFNSLNNRCLIENLAEVANPTSFPVVRPMKLLPPVRQASHEVPLPVHVWSLLDAVI